MTSPTTPIPSTGLAAQIAAAWDADHAPPRRRGEPEPTPPPPPGRVWLAPDQLACSGCGHTVPRGVDASMTAETVPVGRHAIQLGRCSGCAALHVHARRMLGEHALVADEVGLARTLAVFRVLGQSLPDPRKVTANDVRRWFGRFDVTWATRIWDGTEHPGTAAAESWGHVTADARTTLREQHARWLRTRVRPGAPITVGPPAGGLPGCLFCGVDRVELAAALAHEIDPRALWAPVRVSPAALGGSGAERLNGALCPACDAACTDLDGLRVIGPTSLERSLAEHWDQQGHHAQAQALRAGELAGAVGWGALAVTAGQAPSRVSWDHIALPALTEETTP